LAINPHRFHSAALQLGLRQLAQMFPHETIERGEDGLRIGVEFVRQCRRRLGRQPGQRLARGPDKMATCPELNSKRTPGSPSVRRASADRRAPRQLKVAGQTVIGNRSTLTCRFWRQCKVIMSLAIQFPSQRRSQLYEDYYGIRKRMDSNYGMDPRSCVGYERVWVLVWLRW
jgi:hypothetical protein